MIPATESAATLGALRRVLLAVLIFGMVGTSAELLLLQHDEDALQLIPLLLIGAGLATLGWNLINRSRLSLTIFQIVMVCFVVSGLLGVMLHYQANVEFQLEMDPALAGSNLWWKVLQAKTPPALAPGVMAQLGLIGLAYTYRHPAVVRRTASIEENDL